MASPPNLPTNHVAGQSILATDINDIAAGANGPYIAVHTRSKIITIYSPTAPLSPIPIWRTAYVITVTAIYCYRVGGTGGTFNVRKVVNTTPSNLIASDFSITATGPPWLSAGALVGGATCVFAVGDSLEVVFQTMAGAPTLVAVQIDYTEPVI